jgi:hypothetical protein
LPCMPPLPPPFLNLHHRNQSWYNSQDIYQKSITRRENRITMLLCPSLMASQVIGAGDGPDLIVLGLCADKTTVKSCILWRHNSNRRIPKASRDIPFLCIHDSRLFRPRKGKKFLVERWSMMPAGF